MFSGRQTLGYLALRHLISSLKSLQGCPLRGNMGCGAPDSRAGTLELNLQDDILPDVRTLSSQSY